MAERQRRVVDVLLSRPGHRHRRQHHRHHLRMVQHQPRPPHRHPQARSTNGASAVEEPSSTRLRPKAPANGRYRDLPLLPSRTSTSADAQGGSSFQLRPPQPEHRRTSRTWTLKLEEALRCMSTPGIEDVSSDQDRPGPQADIVIDRDKPPSRMGVSVGAIDAALNNAYAQRQVSIIYTQRNQYRVVLENHAPHVQRDPGPPRPPLRPRPRQRRPGAPSTIRRQARPQHRPPRRASHQGQFPAASINFNLKAGTSQGDAIDLVAETARNAPNAGIHPHRVQGGNAKLPPEIPQHPTACSSAPPSSPSTSSSASSTRAGSTPSPSSRTLPSAGMGAILAVLVTGSDLGVLAIIGHRSSCMGIVKKNAIMLVDFALEAEREHGMTPRTRQSSPPVASASAPSS